MTDTLGVGESDTVLPVVPMFHANAWGLPLRARSLAGAQARLPRARTSIPTSLLDLMASEKVTLAGGVPTIWLGILALSTQNPKRWDLSAMRTDGHRRLGGAAGDDRRLPEAPRARGARTPGA